MKWWLRVMALSSLFGVGNCRAAPVNRPLRVAYLHFTLQAGGVERHILNLVKSLDPGRVTSTVVVTREGASSAMLSEISTYAHHVAYFPASRLTPQGSIKRDVEGFAALVAFLGRSQFDVAFSFVMGGVDDLVGLDAAAQAGILVSVAYVGWTIGIPPGLPIDALELPSDVLVSLQPQHTDSSEFYYDVVRINSPIDLELYNPARFEYSKSVVRRCVVGRVSRLVPEKNPQSFIFIAAVTRKKLMQEEREGALSPDILLLPRFVMAGDGPLLGELKQLVVDLGVSDMVEFYGSINSDAVPELLSTFDIFLYPTFGESYGYVVSEAMAMSLPVVATAIGSIPELVEHGHTGFLVKPHFQEGDTIQIVDDEFIAEMTSHVLNLVGNISLQNIMGQNARLKIRARGVELSNFGEAHALLYEKLHASKTHSSLPKKACPWTLGSGNLLCSQHAISRAAETHVRGPILVLPESTNGTAIWWGGDTTPVFVLNLDRSADRLEHFKHSSRDHGLSYSLVTRISAIDGRSLIQRESGEESEALLEYCPSGTICNSSDSFTVRFLELSFLGPQLKWVAGNVAVSLSHLKAIRSAFDRGLEVALILEDDVTFGGPISPISEPGISHFNGETGGVRAVMEALKIIPDWTVAQLGYVLGDDTDALERLSDAWQRGLLLIPRLPCGNADFRIYGNLSLFMFLFAQLDFYSKNYI